MCRIWYSPLNASHYKNRDLWGFCLRLEKRAGRDGNGIYDFKTDKLYVSTDKMPIWARIEGSFLFHTRMATNGKIADYNCQPFVGDKYIMTHNGVYSEIESYARLLGFKWSEDKYSDSYMMHWIMEKVGIFNFFNALKDENFGVIVAHDKETKTTYLLKGSGTFKTIKLKHSNCYIYASSDLEYWESVNSTAESISNGLYILKTDGYKTLYKKSYTSYHYNYDYNKYTGENWWDQYKETKEADRCQYCGIEFTSEITKYIDGKYTICKKCYEIYTKPYDGHNDIGMSKLFGDSPSSCNFCQWLKDETCYFGGIKQKGFKYIKDIDGKIICHTNSRKYKFNFPCSICKKNLTYEDFWQIKREGEIYCKDCLLEDKPTIEDMKRICNSCRYFDFDSEDEPCRNCATERNHPNWRPPFRKNGVNVVCDTCHHENEPSSGSTCKDCIMKNGFRSNWKSKDYGSCDICGQYFEDEDQIYYDKNGYPICDICDSLGYYTQNERMYIKRYYE